MPGHLLQHEPVAGTLHRLTPSRFPPVSLFEFARSARELEVMAELEGYTNDRLRNEVGDLTLVPRSQQRYGPGYTSIMAAFTHIGYPSRFTDGQFGVYYASPEIETALAEVSFHRARFLRASSEPATQIALREYRTTCIPEVTFPGIDTGTGGEYLHPAPSGYAPAQALGKSLRDQGEYGLRYPSVRRQGGQCLAVLRPDALNPATQGSHFNLVWDGEKITHCFALTNC